MVANNREIEDGRQKRRTAKVGIRASLGDSRESREGNVGEVLRGGGDGAAAAELRHICLCTCVGGAST